MTNPVDNLEVEVKFFVPDLVAMRETLLAAGATIKKPRVYERNVRFDTPDQSLRERRELLRLRQDTAVRATFKSPSAEQTNSEAKVMEEIEVEVSDFDKASLIFQRLGFAPVQVYEKYRETLQLEQVEIVLDEMPYGNFIELEGSEARIKAAVATLGIDWEKRIITNYLGLMAQMKEKHKLSFDDLTFANFADLGLSVASVLE
jgi:adenylate cyclase class 2